MGVGVDTRGAIHEGLLERNAGEVKTGAGQDFTPRDPVELALDKFRKVAASLARGD
jgi:type I restriction enzyme M protein